MQDMFRGESRKDKRLKMTKSLLIGGVAASMLALSGCIHVDDDGYSDVDEIAYNTETALRVCGGPGTVAEVTDDGFQCKENAD